MPSGSLVKSKRYETTSVPGIYEVAAGKYEIRVHSGKDNEGKYKPYREQFTGSLKEAKARKAELETLKSQSKLPTKTKLTIKEFLGEWLDVEVSERALKTKEWYTMHVKNNICPYIGNKRIGELTPSVISRFYKDLKKDGKSSTIRGGVHRTLRRALNWGIAMRYLSGENPIKGITEPKVEKEEPEVLTEEEVYRFVDTSRIVAPELTNLFIVCILTGIRKGEAFGLRWSDIDFNKRTIHISQQLIKDGINPIFSQPKTYTGRRTIPISDNAINALLEEKDKQDDFKANQPQYNDYDLVFSQSNGRPLSHKSTYKKIHKCFKATFADKDYGFHVFRHSFISIHLNNGTPIATVSELSGHKQTSTTLNMYAHAYESSNISAAKRIDTKIFGDGHN